MNYKLFEFFSSLEDPRRGQGQRHKLSNIMAIVIMAILTGEQGFRGFSRFAKSNAEELADVLEMKHGIPGYNTIRSTLLSIDEDTLVREFIKWTQNYLPEICDDEFVALDGKAVRATSEGGSTSEQNFVSVVNAFGHKSGVVYGMQPFENSKSGEAQALRDLVEKLGVKNVVFTVDALHTQKKLST
jgi:hypothetical protein